MSVRSNTSVPEPVQAEFAAWLEDFGTQYEEQLERFVRTRRYEGKVLPPGVGKEPINKWIKGPQHGGAWAPEAHPRHPAGTEKGGEFAPKGEGTTETAPPPPLPPVVEAPPETEEQKKKKKKGSTAAGLISEHEAEMFDAKAQAEKMRMSKTSSDSAEGQKKHIQRSIGNVVNASPEFKDMMERVVKESPPGAHNAYATIFTKFNAENPGQGFTTHLVSTWASTSGDSHPVAMHAQLAVLEEFKLNARIDHMGGKYGTGTGLSREQVLAKAFNSTFGFDGSPEALESYDRAVRRFQREQYNQTQTYFKAHGIKELNLYRGIRSTPAPDDRKGPHFRTSKLQPASSFSTNEYTSRNFGNTLLLTKVPVERVLGTYVTGYGCKSEHEVVLLGGQLPTIRIFAHKGKQVSAAIKRANQRLVEQGLKEAA